MTDKERLRHILNGDYCLKCPISGICSNNKDDNYKMGAMNCPNRNDTEEWEKIQEGGIYGKITTIR